MADKRFFKITAPVICLIVALACFIGCKKNKPTPEEQPPEPARVEISAENASLGIGETLLLTVSGTESFVTWQSRDDGVATVTDGGVVTGVSIGQTYIIASVDGYDDMYCRITVSAKPEAVPTIRLDGEIKYEDGYSLSVAVGEAYTLRPYLVVGEETPDVTFSLGASANIEVKEMSFTATAAIADGFVTVTCEYEGTSYKLNVAVSAQEITE